MTPQEFAQTFGPLANDISQQTGLDPALVLGQAAQETGWGNHYVGGNLWGISPTDPASGQQEVARYPTVESGAQAYVDLINRRYAAAGKAQGVDAQAQALASLGYNKNPGYAAAIARNARQAQSYLGGTQVAADQSSAPSSADLLKQMQGLRAPAPATASTAVTTDAPSSDDLLKQMQAMGGKGAQPQQEQQTAAAPPTAQPTLPPGTPSWLAPDPSRQYGEIVPVSRDIKTGELHYPSLPNILRQPLIGLTTAFGPGLAPGGGVQISPGTNTLSLAPETAAAANLLGARPSPAAGTGRAVALQAEAPLSSEFRASPFAATMEGRPGTPPSGAASPTGVKPPPSAPPPQTSAEGAKLASGFYKFANDNGGTISPEAASRYIDYVQAAVPKSEWAAAVPGTNSLAELAQGLERQRGQPMTLQDFQEFDERMGDYISSLLRSGRNKEAGTALDIQHGLRDQVTAMGPQDATGGTEGFAALAPARQAWSQQMKMRDVERMRERAQAPNVANPQANFSSQVDSFLRSNRSRGWTDEEKAALRAEASQGISGFALKMLGNRLLPSVAAAIAGSQHPVMGPVLDAAAAYGGTEAAQALLRRLNVGLMQRRAASSMNTLSAGYPPSPYNPLGAGQLTVAPSQRPILLPGIAGAASQTFNQQPPP